MYVLLALFYFFFNPLTSLADDYVVSNRTFPEDFKFGLATAAFQVEGAWNESGKGENIWDHDTHYHPEKYQDGANADVTSDCYHKYKEDVALMKDFGVKAYRFSISWSRILPTGYNNKINQPGIEYYKNLMAELKAANIEPHVTMYHWDLPQPLQEIGGWPNPLLIDIFVDYARVLFENFGDEVIYWITFNEPKQVCEGGYGTGHWAPGAPSPGIGVYLCAHNVIRAHAKVYRMYEEEFKPTQKGKLSMAIDTNWCEPGSNSTEDIEAAERTLQFTYGWWANPMVNGDYPQVMKDRIKYRSEQEGFNKSRLPEFTDEEKEYIKGTADFLTINMYTSSMIKHADEPAIGTPSRDKDLAVSAYADSSWESTIEGWFKVVPWGARKVVKWISDTYNHPEIIVTENGYVDDGNVDDMDTRGRYHKLYLSNLQDAIYLDNVNLTGYMAWSLLDNFEWHAAYKRKLGFYHVDFSDPNRTRTPKASQAYYKHVCQTRCLIDECVD